MDHPWPGDWDHPTIEPLVDETVTTPMIANNATAMSSDAAGER